MPVELSPIQAAEVATSAYALRLSTDLLDAAVAATSVSQDFSIMAGKRLTGSTGMGITSASGFGYIAFGKTVRQGEVLISIRGTYKTSPYDWLTNLRMSATPGPSGYLVHSGFWRAAQTLLPQIIEELKKPNRNPSALHIIGHSLGGAMATLVADRLKGIAGTRLYTFGAPRSGLAEHADYLTTELTPSCIRRVYHHTDPVPMVPVFPFLHLPHGDAAHLMPGCGTLVSLAAHGMDEYEKSVGAAGWNALPKLPNALGSFEAADEWLARAASEGGTGMMMSATAMRLILSALGWILRKIGQGVGTAVLVGATMLDQLASVLYSGVLQSLEMASMIGNMLAASLRFMGRTMVAGTKISVMLIQYVLELLFRTISMVAIRAVDRFN